MNHVCVVVSFCLAMLGDALTELISVLISGTVLPVQISQRDIFGALPERQQA